MDIKVLKQHMCVECSDCNSGDYEKCAWMAEQMAEIFTFKELKELSKPGAKLVVQCADQTHIKDDLLEYDFAYLEGQQDLIKAGFVKVVGGSYYLHLVETSTARGLSSVKQNSGGVACHEKIKVEEKESGGEL